MRQQLKFDSFSLIHVKKNRLVCLDWRRRRCVRIVGSTAQKGIELSSTRQTMRKKWEKGKEAGSIRKTFCAALLLHPSSVILCTPAS